MSDGLADLPAHVILTSAEQLLHCEKEDIQHPELIQGMGALLVLDPQTGSLIRWSENAPEILGFYAFEEGLNLAEVLPFFGADLLNWLQANNVCDQPKHMGTQELSPRATPDQRCQQIELLAHQPLSQPHYVVIECIPITGESCNHSENRDAGELERLLDTLKAIEASTNLDALLQHSATSMQALSEYDRVMVYRFDEDWHGQIVAEATALHLEQRFLGQHFPASDIPPQARALYERNLLRVVADVSSVPVKLLPVYPDSKRLDQSTCLLRSPSPFHLDYLRNMGVRSTLGVSIMVEGQLWGMLTCHHGQPRSLPHKIRYTLLTAMEVLGRAIANQVDHVNRLEAAEQQLRFIEDLKRLQAEPQTRAATNNGGYEVFLDFLKQWFEASHATLFMNGHRIGDPLTAEAERWCVEELNHSQRLHITHKISLWPQCQELAEQQDVGGALLFPLKNLPGCGLFLARPAVKFSRSWGGRPDTFSAHQTQTGEQVLGARRSFELWQEEVKDQSRPWGPGWESCLAEASVAISAHHYRLKIRNQDERSRVLNKALEAMPDFVLITGATPSPATGRRLITYANPALCQLTGYTEKELIGQPPAIFHGPGTNADELLRISESLRSFKSVVATLQNYTKSGIPYWVELKIVPVDDGQGFITHFVSVQRDITEQQAMTRQLADRERAMAAILDTIPETLIDLDRDGNINAVYAGNHHLFGKPLESYVGKPLSYAIPDRVSSSLIASVDQHQKADAEFGTPEQSKFYLARMAGKSPDSEQAATGYVCALTDISERKKEQLKAQYNAEHDSLTGLLNRTGLEKYLDKASSASGQNAAALFIDLDRFKIINDAHGHRTGDGILREVAQRIRSAMNQDDVVARIGGDEFIVLMTAQADEIEAIAHAQALAESIRTLIAAPFLLWGVSYEVDCSIGIAVSDDMLDYQLDLMACSDMAMYAAKKKGGGIQVFESSMHKTAKYYHQIEADLSNALRQGGAGLKLVYQPIVTHNRQVVGYEALIRWQRCDLGAIPPSEFIPVAEQTSLIVELGNWVLKTACDTLAAWSRSPEAQALTLSVNISALQIQQPSFVDQVLALLHDSGVPANRLKLEITETLLHYDLQDTIDKMRLLKTAGVECSLDDFGTGYSSLAYLQRLPLDEVKIDLQFVQTMLQDPNAEAIVKLIINLAKTLNLRVVAEGVENQNELTLLETLGCQHFQGYFFGRPQADPYRLEDE